MSKVFFTSDLHLGHRNILKFQPNRYGWMPDVKEPRRYRPEELMVHMARAISRRWSERVSVEDTVWVLGDVIMGKDITWLTFIQSLPGTKRLVLGNHDELPIEDYLKVFDSVHGFVSKYKLWLSHAPIHYEQLRNRPSIHGHCHSATPQEIGRQWYDVGVDANDGYPVSLEQLRNQLILSSEGEEDGKRYYGELMA